MNTGIVNIKGRSYKTVALRVAEFREQCPAKDGWAILTEITERNDEFVVVKAIIAHEQLVVATGFAEEHRSSSQINKTSALENCETSAIGRALAAFGLGGSEYASANEVANAIHQQSTKPTNAKDQKNIDDALEYIAGAPTDEILTKFGEDSLTKQNAVVQDAVRSAYTDRRKVLRGKQHATSDS